MVLKNYLSFFKNNIRFLAFGLLMTIGSSFGQTYFIALFSLSIRSELTITHGEFGLLYSLATLTSGVALIWLGRKIDDVNLQSFCIIVTLSLAISCLIMFLATNIYILILALFCLRITGQGLMCHAASTSMARYFTNKRGLALSISSAGLPIGEAIFPFITVFLMTVFYWRDVWLLIGVLVAFVFTSLIGVTLKGHKKRHALHLSNTKKIGGRTKSRHQWSISKVIREHQFYQICLVAITPAFILTGLFFHQVYLAELKGWSLKWLAICFAGFAISRLLSALLIGPMIDRFTARIILPWYLLPLALGLIILTSSEHVLSLLIFMVFAGISTGSGANISSALWAELYGPSHLGAIKSLATAIMVFSSALSPAFFGLLLDNDVSMNYITSIMAAYICLVSTNCFFRLKKINDKISDILA